MLKILSLIFLLFLLSSQKTSASLYVNEFSSDTAGTVVDPDWVEIYNSGPDSVDLSLYRLRDNTTVNKKDLSGTLQANSFISFDWSNKLNKTGDVIKLLLINDETTPIDQVAYGDAGNDVSAPSAGQSAGRQGDGLNPWAIFSTPTKGSTNNTSTPVPTQTPTSRESSSPSVSSTPTSTLTATPKPSTPKPTIPLIPTPTPKATTVSVNLAREINSSESSLDILGTETAKPSLSPTKRPQEVKTLGIFETNFPKILIGLGIIIIVSGAGIYIKSKI